MSIKKKALYLDHRTVDGKCNFIVDCFITPENVHDSVPYLSRLTTVIEKFGFAAKYVALDSGYANKGIFKFLEDRDIFFLIGYRKFSRNVDNKWFVYEASNACFADKKTGEFFTYRNIDRNGYKQYRIADNSNKRMIHQAIDADLHNRCHQRRLSPFGKAWYQRRKETIERSFADSKPNHGIVLHTIEG